MFSGVDLLLEMVSFRCLGIFLVVCELCVVLVSNESRFFVFHSLLGAKGMGVLVPASVASSM